MGYGLTLPHLEGVGVSKIETPLFNQGAAKLLWGVDYSKEDTSQPVSPVGG
jgi:hypothetical protein